METEDVTLRVVLDAIMLILVFLPVIIFKFAVYPFRRGFFCDDESIAHPFKESTISTVVLIVVGLGLPMAVMLVTEIIIYIRKKRSAPVTSVPPPKAYTFCKYDHIFLVTLYQVWGPFLFGCAANQSATDIFKYSIGRLRPHFIDVCKPDYAAFNCTNVQQQMLYIEEDVCTGDKSLIKEARLSHVSGHASMSVYVMVYLVFYLQYRFRWRGSRLLRPLLQVVCLYMALYTCLSRISDYKHHWSDVLGGSILGFSVALLTIRHITIFFKHTGLKRSIAKVLELQNMGSSNNAYYGREKRGTDECCESMDLKENSD